MNISIKYSKHSEYDLSPEENLEVTELMLGTMKPVIIEIYEKFVFKHDSPQVANQILAHVKKRLFNDSDIKVVMRIPRDTRKDAGTILNYVKVVIGEKEMALADLIFHMSVIKLEKAFIKIK